MSTTLKTCSHCRQRIRDAEPQSLRQTFILKMVDKWQREKDRSPSFMEIAQHHNDFYPNAQISPICVYEEICSMDRAGLLVSTGAHRDIHLVWKPGKSINLQNSRKDANGNGISKAV
jgi:hypothetical protein